SACDSGSARLEIAGNTGRNLETQWVLPVPTAKLSSRDAQQISSGAPVALRLEQVQFDNDHLADRGRLVCRTAGLYSISARVEFSANGKGSRQVIVRRNGGEDLAAMRVPAVEGETTQITFTAPPVRLEVADYVEVLVRQTSGETLELPVSKS